VYIANNSRTQRSSVPKFGRNVPHLRCDSLTSFKVKSSKVKVTRRINADTHRAPYLPNTKVYELQTWYTDGRRRPASAVGAMTSKGRGQGYKITWSVWAVLAQWLINWKRTVVVSPITKIGRMVPHDTCYIAQQFQCQKIKSQGHRPTNADTQNVSYLPNGMALKNFKVGMRMEDVDPHQRQVPWPPILKVKVTRSHGRGIPCRPNPVATPLVSVRLYDQCEQLIKFFLCF